MSDADSFFSDMTAIAVIDDARQSLQTASSAVARATATLELAAERMIDLRADLRGVAELQQRRRRDEAFACYSAYRLFGEPAWNILLTIFTDRDRDRRNSVSSLCIASAVPVTTALSCIKRLEAAGLVHRVDDPADKRRMFVELSSAGADRMRAALRAQPGSRL